VPNLESQFLVGHIHLVASTAASTKAAKKPFISEGKWQRYVRTGEQINFDERQQEH
jgi:hypothetical protein